MQDCFYECRVRANQQYILANMLRGCSVWWVGYSTRGGNALLVPMWMRNRSYRFHSEILASQNFNKNKIMSPGLENNHTQKCCFGNFPTYSYMSRLLEKSQINIWMYGYSQIQRTRLKKDGELRDKSVPYFQQESGPCPRDWRITIHWNVDLVFLQQSWYIWLCWKIARTTFQCMDVPQSRGQNFILVEI